MNTVNKYTVIQSLVTLNDQINLWLCENEAGENVEVLTIQKPKNDRTINRLFQNEIRPLIDAEIEVLQPILEVGFDEDNHCHYVVYKHLVNYNILLQNQVSATIQSILDVANCLNNLKNNNHQKIIITPESILINSQGNTKLKYVGLYDLFKKENILNPAFLAPNVVERSTNRKLPKPNFQDDIYSLIKTFEFLLQGMEHENIANILEKSLHTDRKQRFAKYHELIDLLETLPQQKNYTTRDTIRIVTKGEDYEKFRPILEEMNKSVWFEVESKLSKHEKKQITGRFTTKNWNGRFFVDNANHLFISYKHCYNSHRSETRHSKNSFLANFDFDFNSFGDFNCVSFFTEKFNLINELEEANRVKHNALKKWQTLPEKEKEYIEQQAFKVKFHKREARNGNDVVFHLKDVNGRKQWNKIKRLKSDEVVLFIGEQKIGKILDWRSKSKIITIRDIYCEVEEIPTEGELMQDVRQEISQYKKQIEACQKFKSADITNPELASILATPENANFTFTHLDDEDYEDFEKELYNNKFGTNKSQFEAVLEALHQKPVYLIQGPPGTGKTTVIVEIIQQLKRLKSDVKILVVSQSNMAVDNVLEKLAEEVKKHDLNLGFMRLASEFTLEKDNVTKTMLPHTYEEKLKSWVKATEQKSNQFLEKRFQSKLKQKQLIEFYDFYTKLNQKTDWEIFQNRLRISINYLKKIFRKASNFKAANAVFEKELGKDFMGLKRLQTDWFSFLNGVTVDDNNGERKKSMLNNGSTEIDFLTAMTKDMNVIGATCIHIASSAYSKVNFKFDYVIMDESSKASPAETLVPLNMGKNVILIGDHKQLPPIVTRENAVKNKVKKELNDNGLDFDKEFGVSLFEQLITTFEREEQYQLVKMLDIQYRMPRQIGSLISKYFYDGELQNPSSENVRNYDLDKQHNLPLKKETSMLFISTSNEENPQDNGNKKKRQNWCNVEKIKELLENLNKQYADNLEKDKPFTIGIIAGYRGQVDLLKQQINLDEYENFILKDEDEKKMNLIEINTVDKFQGAERDIIIYDVVRSDKGKSNIGFLDDYRRINVAFSRVKRLLFVIGDSEYLLKRATLNPNGKFKEFKLQQITQAFQNQGLIINNLKEILR